MNKHKIYNKPEVSFQPLAIACSYPFCYYIHYSLLQTEKRNEGGDIQYRNLTCGSVEYISAYQGHRQIKHSDISTELTKRQIKHPTAGESNSAEIMLELPAHSDNTEPFWRLSLNC